MNQEAKQITGVSGLTSSRIDSVDWQTGENTIVSFLKLGAFLKGKGYALMAFASPQLIYL